MALGVKTGTYTGNGGASQAITGVGFKPRLLFIKGVTNATQLTYTNDAMAAGNAQGMTQGQAAGAINSLDVDGFTVGSGLNTNAVVYYYIAVTGTSDVFATGTYTGSGAAQNITSVGFQPDLVFVSSSGSQVKWQPFTSLPGSTGTLTAGGSAIVTSAVTGQLSNGFSVGTNGEVSTNGTTYQYVALKLQTNVYKDVTYTGNGVDLTNITSVGFQSTFVLIKGNTGISAHVRFAGESGANSMPYDNTEFTGRIEAILSNGFQLGTDTGVNGNGTAYYAVCFKDVAFFDPSTLPHALFTPRSFPSIVMGH